MNEAADQTWLTSSRIFPFSAFKSLPSFNHAFSRRVSAVDSAAPSLHWWGRTLILMAPRDFLVMNEREAGSSYPKDLEYKIKNGYSALRQT